MGKKEFKPLSKAARPTHYKVTLQPNFETFQFNGSEVVDIEITRETKRIIVNSLEIQVTEAVFQNADQAVKSSEIVYDVDNETVTFRFPNPLPVGPAQLKLEFTGELNDKMKGFYRSKYTKSDGTETYIAVTQFEPTDARRAFPCWDEPAVKATFDIIIVAPQDKVVLSNMDVLEENPFEDDGTLKVVSFKTTPIMSTYLVAFVVGDFEYIEGKSSDGIALRVYTPLGKKEQGKFALEIASKTLPFYSDYFGIPYPLPKMDLIAIPDFAAGAMENWGLVTYRETCLLVDNENSSKAAKQWVALVVGHEIAHQWFGNLTTMVWWTDLWLNEGFASWIEYLCVDFCCPDFDIWTQFVCNDFTKALELDGLANSHPIEVEVGHPSEIDEIFDAISYSKGASVIRMLHEYLGEKDFKAGLHNYLTKFQYKNGKTDDLWEQLEKASKKPVERVMSTWTKQMGYPVISVSSEQTGPSQKVLKISQKKFTADGSEDPNNSQWQVPITIATSKTGKKELSTLLSDPDMVLFLDGCPENAWVKLNPGQVCFYRTNYSSEMLESIIPAISTLSAVDRLGIQNDMFSLAVAGYCPTTNFLQVLKGYSDEDNYTVWCDIDANLSKIAVIMQNHNSMEEFKQFVLQLYKPVGERLGWEPKDDEDHLTGMLRGLILGRLGCYGDPETLEECRRRFKDHVDNSQLIPADLRVAVYSTVSVHGDQETFDQLIQLYEGTDHMEEQVRIVRLIGASQSEEIIQKALEYALSEKVRSADTVFSLAGCTRSLRGRQMTWDFVKQNWDDLYKRYDGGFLLSRLIKISTQNLATEDEAKDVEAFFQEHETPAAERVIKQCLENIALNCKWLARDAANILDWLSKN